MQTSSLPFHESIVLLIRSAQSEVTFRQYANLAKLTSVPDGHKEIIKAVSERGKTLGVADNFLARIAKEINHNRLNARGRPAHETILIQLENVSSTMKMDVADAQLRATGYVITRTHLSENTQKIRGAFKKAAERIGFQKADAAFYDTVMKCLHEYEPA